MTVFHTYDPAEGHQLPHDPLNAIIAPRPIGWISTMSADGARNLAPYSFFNLINYSPPLIAFASSGWKDSVANVDETGEFVWNLATMAQAEQMNVTSASVDGDVDEFDLAGLATLPSAMVKPDRVAGSPVHFECRLSQLIRLENKEGIELDQWLVIGEVVCIHIDVEMLEDGIYQTARPHPITRGGGPADYFEITEDQLFKMKRPG